MIANRNGLYRYAAFAEVEGGGNPAGVWIGDELPSAAEMLRIAAEVGYSETAFLSPRDGSHRSVRYYSPLAEVPFCGHATIASGVVLGEVHGAGMYTFSTGVGDVPVEVVNTERGFVASLTSVETAQTAVSPHVLSGVLTRLGWRVDELDPAIPPVRAYAGAWHLVLAAREATRIDTLDYDFESMRRLMLDDGLTTLQLVHRLAGDRFESRNPFPVGGVVEDPATGAAAAALGGYLRDAGLIATPASIVIRQGVAMGRPSLIRVAIPASGGIIVSGGATRIAD